MNTIDNFFLWAYNKIAPMRRKRLLRVRIVLLWVRVPSVACGSSSMGRAHNTVSAFSRGFCRIYRLSFIVIFLWATRQRRLL